MQSGRRDLPPPHFFFPVACERRTRDVPQPSHRYFRSGSAVSAASFTSSVRGRAVSSPHVSFSE